MMSVAGYRESNWGGKEMMMTRFLFLVLSLTLLVCQSVVAGMASAGDASVLGRQILVTTGVKGGLVIHVG
jgi:hypothetical protein